MGGGAGGAGGGRFDCQFLMGLFAYMYHSTFIKVRATAAVHTARSAHEGRTPCRRRRYWC
jgi:hypothetical protein